MGVWGIAPNQNVNLYWASLPLRTPFYFIYLATNVRHVNKVVALLKSLIKITSNVIYYLFFNITNAI